MCLTPNASGINATWQFTPRVVTRTLKNLRGYRRASARGILGFPFLLHSAVDLSKCAVPYISQLDLSANSSYQTPLKVQFEFCNVNDTRLLWWFSGAI